MYIAQSLRIVHNTEILFLSENGINLTSRFIPEAADTNAENVVDAASVIFNSSQHRKLLNHVNRLLGLARHWQDTHVGHPVYLEFKPDWDDTDYYRTEIQDGRVVLDGADGAMRISRGVTEAQIIVQHVPYWEGPETQVPLSDVQNTRTTSAIIIRDPDCTYMNNNTISFHAAAGMTPPKIKDSAGGLAQFLNGDTITVIGSHLNDGTYTVLAGAVAGTIVTTVDLIDEAIDTIDIIIAGQPKNFVDIVSQDVEGDLPAPVKLEFTDLYSGGAGFIRDIWLAHNVFSDPFVLSHIWEAEGGYGGTPGVLHTSVYCSAGGFIRYGLVAAPASTLIFHSFAAGQLDAMGSNWFRLLCRIENALIVADAWLRISIYAGNLTLVYESDWVNIPIGKKLFELCTFQMPPYLAGGGVTNLYVRVEGKSAIGTDIDFDFLQLSPMDGWKKYIANADGLDGAAPPLRLVDDEIDNYLYGDDGAGADKRYAYYTTSSPILLRPGMDQRLIFLWENYNSPNYYSLITCPAGIKVWYRPRRSTI